jgi:hypothetical protein
MDLLNTTKIKLVKLEFSSVNARLLKIKNSDIFTYEEKEILINNYEEEIDILLRKMRQLA